MDRLGVDETRADAARRATDSAASYAGEGMALKGSDRYLISEDGPSHLFHFRLDA